MSAGVGRIRTPAPSAWAMQQAGANGHLGREPSSSVAPSTCKSSATMRTRCGTTSASIRSRPAATQTTAPLTASGTITARTTTAGAFMRMPPMTPIRFLTLTATSRITMPAVRPRASKRHSTPGGSAAPTRTLPSGIAERAAVFRTVSQHGSAPRHQNR